MIGPGRPFWAGKTGFMDLAKVSRHAQQSTCHFCVHEQQLHAYLMFYYTMKKICDNYVVYIHKLLVRISSKTSNRWLKTFSFKQLSTWPILILVQYIFFSGPACVQTKIMATSHCDRPIPAGASVHSCTHSCAKPISWLCCQIFKTKLQIFGTVWQMHWLRRMWI